MHSKLPSNVMVLQICDLLCPSICLTSSSHLPTQIYSLVRNICCPLGSHKGPQAKSNQVVGQNRNFVSSLLLGGLRIITRYCLEWMNGSRHTNILKKADPVDLSTQNTSLNPISSFFIFKFGEGWQNLIMHLWVFVMTYSQFDWIFYLSIT